MTRKLVAAVAALTALLSPAAASAAELTPPGEATIIPSDRLPMDCPASYQFAVQVAWQVRVGEGGQAGIVRPVFGSVVGDPVELPATPGTYTFPAPHIHPSGCRNAPGINQVTGQHAIVVADQSPGRFLNVSRPGQADEQIDARRLDVVGVYEPDNDSDGLGDLTEDRTDLRVATAPARDPDGRVRVAVTVTNAGPISATGPELQVDGLPSGRFLDGGCTAKYRYPGCALLPMAPGETRTLTLVSDQAGAVNGTVRALAEGADLAPADNAGSITLAAAPAFDLDIKAASVSKGITLLVRSGTAGTAKVTASFRVRHHTVRVTKTLTLPAFTQRPVTLRARGAALRSLRRHLPSSAKITVKHTGAAGVVTATTRVRR